VEELLASWVESASMVSDCISLAISVPEIDASCVWIASAVSVPANVADPSASIVTTGVLYSPLITSLASCPDCVPISIVFVFNRGVSI
jgi:hypothetical protein